MPTNEYISRNSRLESESTTTREMESTARTFKSNGSRRNPEVSITEKDFVYRSYIKQLNYMSPLA